MTAAIFCPVCRGVILQGLEPTKAGYSRMEAGCSFCKHKIMIHDFGRVEL